VQGAKARDALLDLWSVAQVEELRGIDSDADCRTEVIVSYYTVTLDAHDLEAFVERLGVPVPIGQTPKQALDAEIANDAKRPAPDQVTCPTCCMLVTVADVESTKWQWACPGCGRWQLLRAS
jgi:hypothetical protein